MDAIELMASAMQAAERRLDVGAENLSNAATDGFRARTVRELLTPSGMVARVEDSSRAAPLVHTGRAFDLALAGPGALRVRAADGAVVALRSASFTRSASGELRDSHGRVLLGTAGPLRVGPNTVFDERGVARDGDQETGKIPLAPGASLESGFREGSSVDAVAAMVGVLAAQRAFETAEKSLAALDAVRQKSADEIAQVRS
ncbi:MAG: flagellar basal body rod C-terminal domain-containing protein [Vulcanimicrobiaceae bacterium]